MKLYDRDAWLFTGTASLPPFEDDDSSDPATAVVVVTGKEAHKKLPRCVRFDDANVVQHDNTVVTSAEQCRALWYSEQDIHLFRLQNRNHIRRLRHLELCASSSSSAPPSWGTAYTQVYRAYCQARSDSDSSSGLFLLPSGDNNTTTACTLDALTIGMERRAVAHVVRDTLARRRKIWAQVATWQRSALCRNNPALRDRMVREMSHQLSRPAVLYAQHVAAVSAATVM